MSAPIRQVPSEVALAIRARFNASYEIARQAEKARAIAWARFPAVETNLQYSDRPRTGPLYWFPIIFIRRKATKP